jgi:hypothetical protein
MASIHRTNYVTHYIHFTALSYIRKSKTTIVPKILQQFLAWFCQSISTTITCIVRKCIPLFWTAPHFNLILACTGVTNYEVVKNIMFHFAVVYLNFNLQIDTQSNIPACIYVYLICNWTWWNFVQTTYLTLVWSRHLSLPFFAIIIGFSANL